MTASRARRIEEFSRNAGITPFVTVLASWALLLSRLSDRNDVIVGCPAVGRLSVDMAGVAGYFVNTLPLRVPTRDGETSDERAQPQLRPGLALLESFSRGQLEHDAGKAAFDLIGCEPSRTQARIVDDCICAAHFLQHDKMVHVYMEYGRTLNPVEMGRFRAKGA